MQYLRLIPVCLLLAGNSVQAAPTTMPGGGSGSPIPVTVNIPPVTESLSRPVIKLEDFDIGSAETVKTMTPAVSQSINQANYAINKNQLTSLNDLAPAAGTPDVFLSPENLANSKLEELGLLGN